MRAGGGRREKYLLAYGHALEVQRGAIDDEESPRREKFESPRAVSRDAAQRSAGPALRSGRSAPSRLNQFTP